MSIGDTVFIFFLALIFFGPKKLPELARQLGKLVAEFRRASNEFRFQMEEEMRMADQADAQKKLADLQTAQPGEAAPAIAAGTELTIMPPETGLPVGASTDPAYGTESAEPADEYQAAESGSDGDLSVDLPVEHESSQLSALLGPPSQADALLLPEAPLDAWGSPRSDSSQSDLQQHAREGLQGSSDHLRESSDHIPAETESIHAASGDGPFDASPVAALKEAEMPQEVHTHND